VRCFVGFLALGLASSCLSPAQRRQETLSRVSREFTDGLRWGRYDRVTPYLSPEDARLFFQRVDYAGTDLAMADAEITSVTMSDDAQKATVVANLSWYNQRKALLRSATFEQEWQWSDGRWLCAKQRRLHGDRFPLLPEPLATAPPTGGTPSAAGETPPLTNEAPPPGARDR